MFDTITVNARVSDNEHLSYINVTLTDLNHTPLQASYAVPIQSADFVFNIRYILTQFHLQTGNYFMQITADDGYNTTSFYQPISITESPTLLWGYCTVLKNSSQTINQIDTSGGLISSIVLSQAYNGMKYGTYNQQLYVNGKGTRPFQSFYLQAQTASQLTYNASATVNQLDYTSLYTDGYKPYVGFLNSDINSFDNTGAYGTSYRLNDPNFYPYLFTKTSNYGVGVFKSKIASVTDKIVSFSGFGAMFNNMPLLIPNFKVVAMFEKGNDSVYVFGNDASNQTQAYVFYVPNNSLSSLQNIPAAGKILSAVKVSSNYAIFSTASGIYSVNGISVSSVLSSSGGAQKLAYHPKLNMLVTANSTSSTGSLNLYTVGTNSLTPVLHPSFINCTDSIIDFEVITNK
ncbi:MAG TPA: hypothetical protein VN698_00485 [Bacteroidia bacterium]|nr:hypothetical protein [Bacteroidia bacterium]